MPGNKSLILYSIHTTTIFPPSCNDLLGERNGRQLGNFFMEQWPWILIVHFSGIRNKINDNGKTFIHL